ncbi:MAG: antibiotic biosynthesis monooxygenase [Verrucomicrobiota bacterium]
MRAMILEIATFTIIEGQEAAFEIAIEEAFPIIASVEGYLSHKLERSIENPNKYLLFVWWVSVEAHMVTFRQSESYRQWRDRLQEYFENPPFAEHFNRVNESK